MLINSLVSDIPARPAPPAERDTRSGEKRQSFEDTFERLDDAPAEDAAPSKPENARQTEDAETSQPAADRDTRQATPESAPDTPDTDDEPGAAAVGSTPPELGQNAATPATHPLPPGETRSFATVNVQQNTTEMPGEIQSNAPIHGKADRVEPVRLAPAGPGAQPAAAEATLPQQANTAVKTPPNAEQDSVADPAPRMAEDAEPGKRSPVMPETARQALQSAVEARLDRAAVSSRSGRDSLMTEPAAPAPIVPPATRGVRPAQASPVAVGQPNPSAVPEAGSPAAEVPNAEIASRAGESPMGPEGLTRELHAAASQTALANRPETARQVAAQIAEAAFRRGDSPFEVSLNPEELGRVRLAMKATDSGMVLTVLAERPETMDLMRRHMDQLAAEFSRIGYGDIRFDFGGNNTSHTGDGDPEGFADGSGRLAPDDASEPEAGPAPVHAATEGLDLRL